MPSHKLPPLNALRAFEAAARQLSMKEAGAELHVTPGAVSQMVRSLEEVLGVRLFRRFNRRIALTDAGQAYLPPLRNAFRQIAEATRRIVDAESGTLTISIAPAFGGAWLVPRLGRFRARHPEINLRVISTSQLADFDRDGVDLAIRRGLGRYPGLHSERIAAVELIAVCAPAVLAGQAPRKPVDLLKLPLLHDHDRSDWPLWFAAQGVTHAPHLAGPSFNDLVLLVHAAVAGQGVALVPAVTVERELKSGALVRALKIAWPLEVAYWLVCPTEAADRPKAAAFRAWVLDEAAANRAAPPRGKRKRKSATLKSSANERGREDRDRS